LERLTVKNINTGLPCLNGEIEFIPISKDCIPLLQKGITKLSAYEDTGLTPDDIKAIQQRNEFLEVQNNVLRDEYQQWNKEALTYANQLGMLRIYLDDNYMNLDEMLEAAEKQIKSPSTTDAP
jgi:FtsZ-binding cell division protein ZapB